MTGGTTPAGRSLQPSFRAILGLAVLLALGCAPEPAEEEPESAPADTLREAPPVAPAASAGPPSVTIVEPPNNAEITGLDVAIRLSAGGIRIAPASVHEPGTAHHHLFLDVDPTHPGEKIPAGRPGIIHLGKGDSAFTFRKVAPGAHRIIAVLGDSAHVPIEPMAADTVHVTIVDGD